MSLHSCVSYDADIWGQVDEITFPNDQSSLAASCQEVHLKQLMHLNCSILHQRPNSDKQNSFCDFISKVSVSQRRWHHPRGAAAVKMATFLMEIFTSADKWRTWCHNNQTLLLVLLLALLDLAHADWTFLTLSRQRNTSDWCILEYL